MGIVILLWLAYSIAKALSRRPAPKPRYTLQNKPEYRNQEKLILQQQKNLQQQERNRKQEQKRLQQQQQAENDLQYYINRIDQLYSLLWDLDDEIVETEKQIEIDKLMRSYDSMKKKQARKQQLIKKQLSIENQIHTTEARINKAKYIISAA